MPDPWRADAIFAAVLLGTWPSLVAPSGRHFQVGRMAASGFENQPRPEKRLRMFVESPYQAPESHFYVLLASVVPDTNRHRGYSITVQLGPGTGSPVTVRCCWGRLPFRRQSRLRIFDSQDQAWRYVSRLLEIRKRHGYVVVQKSSRFPLSLAEWEVATPVGRQLWLFDYL